MTNAPSEAANGGGADQWYHQHLRDIVSGDEGSPSDQIQRVLRLGADWFDVELGLLVRVDAAGTTYSIDESSASHPDLTRGISGDLLSTYCRMVVAEKEPLALEHVPVQGWDRDAGYQTSLLSTYIGTDVSVGGESYGTVCFADLEPRGAAFDEDDRSFLSLLAQATTQLLERREGSAGAERAQEAAMVERRYRTALKHSPILFAKIDDELRYEWKIDPRSDVPPEDVVGKRDDELYSGPGIDQLVDLKRRTLERGEQIREEIVFEGSDGLKVHDITATPLREGKGADVTGLITATLDVTDRKEKERRLEESEARYRALAENFPHGAVGVYDRDLQYKLVSGTLVGDTLPSTEEFEGRLVTDVFPETTASDIVPLFRAAVEAGRTDSVETEFGDRNWKVWATPLRDANGEIFAGLSFAQDITEQHRRERTLRLFRQVVEQANDAILITEAAPLDEPGPRIEYVNPSFEEMTGYDADEVLGRTPRLLQGEDTDRAVLDSLREALEHGEAWEGETVNYGKDGTPYHLRWSIAPVRDEEGEIKRWMSIQRDVTEERERENELQRRRNLLNQTQRLAGAWEVELPTETVTWSEKAYEIHEVPTGTAVDLEDALNYFPPEARTEIEAAFQRCVEEGTPYDLEVPLITAQNNRRWVRTVGAPVETDDRETRKVAGAFQDITERKEEEQRRKTVIRRVTDAIVEVDANWRFTLVNEQAEVLTDMQEETLLGTSFWDVFTEALGTRFEDTYRQVMQTREPGALVAYYPGLDGWFDIEVYPNEDGGVAFYFQEVTEQKQREAQLRALSNSLPGVVFQFSVRPDGSYDTQIVSEYAEDMLGMDPEPEMFFERYLERIPDSHRDAVRASVEAAVEEKTPWEFEAPFVTPSGERRWILGRSVPRKWEGEIVFNGVLLDITERKEVERRLDAVFNNTYQFTGLMTPDGTLIEANDSALRFGGVEEADVLGRPLWETHWFQTEEVEEGRLQEAVRQAAEGEFIRYEMNVQGADDIRTVDFSLRPVENEQGETTLIIPEARDITERKNVERGLRQSERRFRKIFENAAIGVAIGGDEGRILRANPAFHSMMNYEENELHHRHFSEIIHPDDIGLDRELFEDLVDGNRDRYQIEKRYVQKDGGVFWARLTASLLDVNGEQKYIALLEDIDKQKRYEEQLRVAKNEAEEAARVKSLMLENMTHEVRTPLTSIIGFSRILKDRLEGKSAKLSRLIHSSAQRLEETTEAALQLSQLEAGGYAFDRETLRLDALARKAGDMFALRAQESSVDLDVEQGDTPVDVYADEAAVRRILSNLLDNALKFTPEGGQVAVRTYVDESGMAVVEVEDTGEGIAEEALPEVFEAFKQESQGLTREYEGAGLGLSIVQKLVDALGGSIEVDTEKGEGTLMKVRFPRLSGGDRRASEGRDG